MKVFISYAREDFAVAERLRNDLEKPGIHPWLDNRKLEPGRIWSEVIAEEITGSDYFLALISQRSLRKKGFIQEEWKHAFSEQKNVIPIRLEDCALPKRMQPLQCADLFPSYDDAVRRLLRHLHRAKRQANFEETFSSLGPDNEEWELREWQLDTTDHTGRGSESLYGEAVAAFGTVTKTASVTLAVGTSTTLRFYKKVQLSGANFMAEAGFKAIIDDNVADAISQKLGGTDIGWTEVTVDVSRYRDNVITLKFVVNATDTLSATTYAKAWIDDVVMR